MKCECTGCDDLAVAELRGKKIEGLGDVTPMRVCQRHHAMSEIEHTGFCENAAEAFDVECDDICQGECVGLLPLIPDDDPPDDLLYEAWVVIANAPGWNTDTEWQQAAERWRDKYHATLAVPTELTGETP